MQRRALLFAATLTVLLMPAIANGFPLIFPDTAPYLGAAYAGLWTDDRSGFYGLVILPVLKLIDGVPGLWAVIVLQAAVTAAVLIVCLQKLVPDGSPVMRVAVVGILALGTALPWHASQLMPDAFTSLVVLLTWLAIMRDPSASGSPLLWFAAVVTAVMHVTHIALMATTAVVVLLCLGISGRPAKMLVSRTVAAAVALASVAGIQIAGNGLNMGRWSISPSGPVFLFARLNEDGLMSSWASRHCISRTSPVCRLQAAAPRDSQEALWRRDGPIAKHVWFASPEPRWHLVEMIAEANWKAIRERPLAFAGAAFRGGATQLVSFRTLDDLCPAECAAPDTTLLYFIEKHRPDLLPAFAGSPQARGELPKDLIRAVTFPITALGLLFLIPIVALAVRRRDSEAIALSAAVLAVIFVNALLTGALSDVNDRYQSRIAWLAPFVVMALCARWYSARQLPSK